MNMILLMFLIAVIFAAILLYIGYSQYSFGFAYLGMFTLLVLGLFIYSDGISIESGMQESPAGSHNFITVYDVHTTVNDPIVNLLAATFFYIPIAGILLTTLIVIRR